jgi:hypothetical protein
MIQIARNTTGSMRAISTSKVYDISSMCRTTTPNYTHRHLVPQYHHLPQHHHTTRTLQPQKQHQHQHQQLSTHLLSCL